MFNWNEITCSAEMPHVSALPEPSDHIYSKGHSVKNHWWDPIMHFSATSAKIVWLETRFSYFRTSLMVCGNVIDRFFSSRLAKPVFVLTPTTRKRNTRSAPEVEVVSEGTLKHGRNCVFLYFGESKRLELNYFLFIHVKQNKCGDAIICQK